MISIIRPELAQANWSSYLPFMGQMERHSLGAEMGPPPVSGPFCCSWCRIAPLGAGKNSSCPIRWVPSFAELEVGLKEMERNILACKGFFIYISYLTWGVVQASESLRFLWNYIQTLGCIHLCIWTSSERFTFIRLSQGSAISKHGENYW